MSTTRRAPKRKRDRRRAETETLRTARRDSLSILLSRAQRGVLSRDEAALLRTHVEAELAEGDAARASERGQQRAMEKHRQRVEAAEEAIRELEAAAPAVDDPAAEQRLAAQQQMHEERRRALADALTVDADTTWPRLVEVARQRDQDARANGDDCRAEHERARRAEQALDRVRIADSLGAALAAVAEYDGLTPQAAAVQGALTDRADTLDARLAEQAREHAVELATARRATREAQAAALRLATRTPTAAERTLDAIRRARTWVEVWTQLGMFYGLRPEECGQQARARRTAAEAAAERRGDGWRRHALEADARADRYRAAWTSARTRAARNDDKYRAERAGRLAGEQLLANTRRYVDAAYDADMCAGVREDLRRLLDGKPPTYGAPWDANAPIPYQLAEQAAPVITDRAAIRNALDEPELADQ